ncbi:cell division cycle-associated protein 2 isoform X2 [Hyla sarda]|uniref:cell division cycle-associated protein 2 isoform X2 n=1 Tax=Hyla sarda TaxID=327740 RepID=UPI0024C348D6|nr:cell division cycle-associated protein 2 isoform X2 [Hyla sarda]
MYDGHGLLMSGETVMARRNVLQEIPIKVPQTEQQSYEIVSEDEGSIPYNKQMSSTDWPHSRYISSDESKENITPFLFDNGLEKKSQVNVLDSGNVGDLLAEPGPSSSSQLNDSSSGAGDIFTPKKTEGPFEDLPPCNSPMNFSTVTVGDLGISTESFTTKCSGKSPKSLHKHRRRSTIGVRGSPEMNFLIRQIALQRSNRKSEPDPLDSPFTSPRNSVLREKISAFRNAFQAVEETEGKPSFPGFSENEKGKEEVPSEPSEKRKKVHDTPGPEASSVLHEPSVTLCPSLGALKKSVPEKTSESDCSLASGSSTEVLTKPVEVQNVVAQTLPSSSRCRKRKVMFTSLLSPPEPEQSVLLKSEASPGPVLKPALKKTPKRDFTHFRVGFAEESRVLFSLEESSDNEENEHINKAEDSIRKKKKVTFGRELSPELFDKSLPANTPLRRGSTPYNHHKIETTPSEEQATCQSPCRPMPQPDFDDKDEEVTLQPLSLCFDAESSDSDSPASSSVPGPKEESNPVEEEEAAIHTSGSNDNDPVMSSMEPVDEVGTLESLSCADIVNEVSPARTRKLRSSDNWKLTSTEESNGSKAAVTTKVRLTVKKARKQTITKKLLIKASRVKGKKKGGKYKKSMQKPLYSEREGILKKPLLSPIPELPECIPTPPASTSQDVAYGKGLNKQLVKKGRAKARAGRVQENNIRFTYEDSLERDVEEKETKTSPPCVVEEVKVDPALEDMKALNSGSPEKSDNLPASEVIDLANPIRGDGPQTPTQIEVTDQLPKQTTTSGPASCLEEKKSKAKNTKRRSSTRKYTSHASELPHQVTPDYVKQDEDAELILHKPKESMDDPVQRTIAPSPMSTVLSEQTTTTSSSLSYISTDHKKSRRSSRIHQTSHVSSENFEQNAPGENGSAAMPHVVDHPDSTMGDFCLPIDEALQFPQQEKKVRRSMRLRRDSGVIGTAWVQENKESEMAGRRKSLSSVTRLEERSELSLGNTVHSPNKENIGSCEVPTITRRTRRRTLCTTTIQESQCTTDPKRRRSSCYHKAPNTISVSAEDVHSTLVPDG